MDSNVLYSCVLLNEKSKEKLIKYMRSIIPPDFDIIAHHMTINLGEIKPEYEKYLGENVELIINSFGYDDKVIAVGCENFPSMNKIPHITIAVNRINGGKPKMSNDLTNWTPIKTPFNVYGVVTQIYKQ